MIRPRVAIWAAPLAFALALGTHASAQTNPSTCTKAHEAIQYRERREGKEADRTIRTNGFGAAAVDIDSRVDIEVDVSCLRRVLSANALSDEERARIEALQLRLGHLAAAARNIDTVAKLLGEAQAAHARVVSDADRAAADRRIADFGAAMGQLVGSLKGAIEQRLIEERVGAIAAARLTPDQRTAEAEHVRLAVEALRDPIYDGDTYDFNAIRDVFSREIDAVEATMRTLTDDALAIEIQAHFIGAGGQPVAIALPRYNDAAAGPATRFERMQFGVTPEQSSLYSRYDSLARSMKSAQGIGAALTSALRVEWEAVRPEMDKLVSGLKASLRNGDAALKQLQERASVTTVTNWLDAASEELRRSPQGLEVQRQWATVDDILQAILEDVASVRALATLPDRFAPGSAEEAMSAIVGVIQKANIAAEQRTSGRAFQLAVWQGRAGALRAFVGAVRALGPDARAALQRTAPMADIEVAKTAAEDIVKALQTTTREAHRWLARAVGADVSRAVASLPIPEGQRRVALTGDANTSINLQTIPAPRSEDDVVQVSYAFYSGGTQLGNSWNDDLQLRAFGWRSRAIAGLAFVAPNPSDQWSPTASLSWIASYRKWPKDKSTGFGGFAKYWGFGFSTMSLNFEPDERVQIGLGATASFIDDRILLGYGYNLQAKSRPGYVFFSLRLFSATGGLGTQ